MATSSRVSDAARGARRIARAPRLELPACRVPEVKTAHDSDPRSLIEHEWLVTNGLGGYSSGTVAGPATRRYHGFLVAALPNPLGRMVMLNTLDDSLTTAAMLGFELQGGIPTWRYRLQDLVVEKRVVMPFRQNTVVVQYRVVQEEEGSAEVVSIQLTPAVHFRGYETSVSAPLQDGYSFASHREHFRIELAGLPALRLVAEGRHTFALREERREQVLYPVEESRGYHSHGSLWSPGVFTLEMAPGETAALIASTETLDVMRSMTAAEALSVEGERKVRLLQAALNAPAESNGPEGQLVIASDQFVIKPVGRVRDTIRSLAMGEELRTVIAGYHWFTDWGRDTMISLEGLTLTTGRHREAGFILRTFSQYVREGLIPNLFPDGSDEGLYHTADATLWFFHALERYAQVTGYWSLVEQTLPIVRGIAEMHMAGTRFGIGVDPKDGLLRQGAEGYQLTWMDAKVDDWVVTPRRGKAVEVNALWYNALSLLARWECDFGDRARSHRYGDAAARVRESFNARFWIADRRHLYDVLDGPSGDDPSCRPNQLFAISLPNPVLDESRWSDVMQVVEAKLLTPVGLRSLAPDEPDYKPRYFGDLRARDAAYHQGTVWAWLIGPWIDAWIKLHPNEHTGGRRFLKGLVGHLTEFGVGSIAEVFDAEPPFTPRGCIAQAWSVAEVLRCWAKTAR